VYNRTKFISSEGPYYVEIHNSINEKNKNADQRVASVKQMVRRPKLERADWFAHPSLMFCNFTENRGIKNKWRNVS
jgi:hypothetical protein